MLQNYSQLDKNKTNLNGFSILDTKMKQSLDGLTHIQNLLNNGETVTMLNHDRTTRLEQDHLDFKTEIAAKDALLLQNLKNIESEQNKYTQLEKRFDALTRHFKLQQQNSEKDLHQLHVENNSLQDNKKELDNMVNTLQELHESDVQRKEKLDLLLREGAQEKKITMKALLERDRRIKELQENLDRMKQQMDEKDQRLEAYASKESEEINQMREDIILLQDVNKGLRQELDDAKRNQIEEQHQKNDAINRVSCLEQELISCQAQLLEKKSQNQEFESAMERVNEHCNVLRTSSNEAAEESAERCQKILSYRDEIRLLKQALHGT